MNLLKIAKNICREEGIDLCLHLPPGSSAYLYGCTDGQTIWLKELVDEYDLFVFFHELGHIVLHHRKGLTYDVYQTDLAIFEHEADDFATTKMIELFGPGVEDICRVCKLGSAF